MRPILTVLLAAMILASVALFQSFQQHVRRLRATPNSALPREDDEVTLHILATCELRADAFTGQPGHSMLAELAGGRWRSRRGEPQAAGEPLRQTIGEGLLLGRNEIYVEMIPDPNVSGPRAARVWVTHRGRPVGETILFEDRPGVALAGVVAFQLEDPAAASAGHGT